MRDWHPLSEKVLKRIRKQRMRRRGFLAFGSAILLSLALFPTAQKPERPYDEPIFEYHAPDGVSLVYFEVDRDF